MSTSKHKRAQHSRHTVNKPDVNRYEVQPARGTEDSITAGKIQQHFCGPEHKDRLHINIKTKRCFSLTQNRIHHPGAYTAYNSSSSTGGFFFLLLIGFVVVFPRCQALLSAASAYKACSSHPCTAPALPPFSLAATSYTCKRRLLQLAIYMCGHRQTHRASKAHKIVRCIMHTSSITHHKCHHEYNNDHASANIRGHKDMHIPKWCEIYIYILYYYGGP